MICLKSTETETLTPCLLLNLKSQWFFDQNDLTTLLSFFYSLCLNQAMAVDTEIIRIIKYSFKCDYLKIKQHDCVVADPFTKKQRNV